MTAVNRSLYIEQGATFTLGFTWHHEGPVVDGAVTPGAPYDLTGWTLRMQARKSQQSPALFDASTTNGKITVGGPGADPTNGRVDIKLTDEDTDALTSSTAKYDLEAEDPAGDVYRLLEGTITVSPNITQDPDDPVLGP